MMAGYEGTAWHRRDDPDIRARVTEELPPYYLHEVRMITIQHPGGTRETVTEETLLRDWLPGEKPLTGTSWDWL